MVHSRKFRFSVMAAAKVTGGAQWAELARKAESLGYSTLVLPDHFTDQLAPTPALMAAAAATTTLRVGTLVYDNDFRHPALLAKEAATIDLLSDGRFEFGLGAGWMLDDYRWTGMPYERAGVRIDKMVEAVHVLRGLWADGPFSYKGTHYTIDEFDSLPKPKQSRLPMLIGGGGKRVLSMAATHADIVGVNPNVSQGKVGPEAVASMTAAATDEKLTWVREAAGERFADLEISILKFVTVVTDDRDGTAATVAKGMGMDAETLLASPHAVVGSVDQIVDELIEQRERWGGSYVTVRYDVMDAFAPVVARLAGT